MDSSQSYVSPARLMPHVFGVLYMLSLSASTFQSISFGQMGFAWPSKSLRTTTTHSPDGPMFFCAPA